MIAQVIRNKVTGNTDPIIPFGMCSHNCCDMVTASPRTVLQAWARRSDASARQWQRRTVTGRPSAAGTLLFCGALARPPSFMHLSSTRLLAEVFCASLSSYLLMYRWCTRDPGSHAALSLAAQPSQPDSDVECLEPEEAHDEAESDKESGLPTCPICKPSLLCP